MGILQARILEWVAMISYIAGRFFTISATWEAMKYGQFSVQLVQSLSRVRLFVTP